MKDIADCAQSIATISALVLSVWNWFDKRRSDMPIVTAKQIGILYDNDRKDEVLIRLEIVPGQREVEIVHLSSDDSSVALTGHVGLTSSDTDPVCAQDVSTKFLREGHSVSWRVPSIRSVTKTFRGYLCIRRYDLNSKEESELSIAIKYRRHFLTKKIKIRVNAD